MAVQPTRLSEQHNEISSSIVRMTFMTSNAPRFLAPGQ
jgi:hypothetical protein